jgi:hypothetical protein
MSRLIRTSMPIYCTADKTGWLWVDAANDLTIHLFAFVDVDHYQLLNEIVARESRALGELQDSSKNTP